MERSPRAHCHDSSQCSAQHAHTTESMARIYTHRLHAPPARANRYGLVALDPQSLPSTYSLDCRLPQYLGGCEEGSDGKRRRDVVLVKVALATASQHTANKIVMHRKCLPSAGHVYMFKRGVERRSTLGEEQCSVGGLSCTRHHMHQHTTPVWPKLGRADKTWSAHTHPNHPPSATAAIVRQTRENTQRIEGIRRVQDAPPSRKRSCCFGLAAVVTSSCVAWIVFRLSI